MMLWLRTQLFENTTLLSPRNETNPEVSEYEDVTQEYPEDMDMEDNIVVPPKDYSFETYLLVLAFGCMLVAIAGCFAIARYKRTPGQTPRSLVVWTSDKDTATWSSYSSLDALSFKIPDV